MSERNLSGYEALGSANVKANITTALATILSSLGPNPAAKQSGLELVAASGKRLVGLAVPLVLAELTNPSRSEAWRAMLARAAEGVLETTSPNGETDSAPH